VSDKDVPNASSSIYASDGLPSMALDSGSPSQNDGVQAIMRIAAWKTSMGGRVGNVDDCEYCPIKASLFAAAWQCPFKLPERALFFQMFSLQNSDFRHRMRRYGVIFHNNPQTPP
jgi:hypothetical protein